MKLRPWPSSADEAPTADEIARAFVPAARETGDLERLAAAVGSSDDYKSLIARSRWLALAALDLLWPRCGLPNLVAKLGGKKDGCWASLAAARSASWWNDHALNRVVDAI